MLYEFKDTRGFMSCNNTDSVLDLNKKIVELLKGKQFELSFEGGENGFVDRIRIADQDKWDQVREVLGRQWRDTMWFTKEEVKKYLNTVDEDVETFGLALEPEVSEQKYAVFTSEASGQFLMRRKDANLKEAEEFAAEWVRDTSRLALVVIGVSRFEEKTKVIVDKNEF
ncbi:hypothetical protein YenMTG1_206 [Yersinia phage vB_YenM_TG1]|uniref:Uncharacterized protein n=1 Tax=Yersinia phage vB_YenM_TG1 TaxID=1589265 RepID=A0A0B5A4N0_9CAUD|nr:hypothetical protein AVV33_gp189 [Yersinia phage vB_YenM_TG1]AJD82016.1 hypothetical protein YenMTG1_206 [Yersinia phage vB_YenM_TG1]